MRLDRDARAVARSITGAPPSSRATAAPSSVADIASSAQLRRDVPLRIEREREADVGVQAALVELVEQHGRDALERGVALQHPREHAFGDDLDAASPRSTRVSSRIR